MGRAEVGTPKYIANKMKAKGLQRLRWYCQVCEKQCRDENGFRCHTQSESHVRQMLIIGENPQRKIAEYSEQFKRDFVSLLKSSHGEKKINFNKFYQEYISDRNHIHMNATRWVSLSEFVKYLADQGICKVDIDPGKEGGYTIAYIDNSPESIRRRDLARKRERGDKDDVEREQKQLERQVKKAKMESEELKKLKMKEGESDENKSESEDAKYTKELQRDGTQPIKLALSFGKKQTAAATATPKRLKLK
ncbi:domain of Kin17 curved DNA-binding protein-domain-containing protein [Lipomyces chichibuensis]|uniref:domain of Kin17 curved DNA-binding protein-domain-containing protein n=1 Tax=Lipomyces chichibuensis TaxID=1546026 RepID=UPI003342F009